MCYTEDLIISTDPSDYPTFRKLYEKLGDGACHLKNYAGAIDYYLKMLDHAELAGDCGKTLIPIYVRYVSTQFFSYLSFFFNLFNIKIK